MNCCLKRPHKIRPLTQGQFGAACFVAHYITELILICAIEFNLYLCVTLTIKCELLPRFSAHLRHKSAVPYSIFLYIGLYSLYAGKTDFVLLLIFLEIMHSTFFFHHNYLF